jgi:hypothetical protein
MMSRGQDGILQWALIMSPTEVDTLKIEVRDKLTLTPFRVDDENMFAFLQWLEPQLVAKYVKPDYRQYAYIEIVPSIMAIVISYSIIFLINIGVGLFVVKNYWHDHYGPELTTAQAAENVVEAFHTFIYEILKVLGIIKLMDKMSGNKKTPPLTEGNTLGGMSPKNYYRPTSRPIFPPPPPLRPVKGKPGEATNTKPQRRKRRPL